VGKITRARGAAKVITVALAAGLAFAIACGDSGESTDEVDGRAAVSGAERTSGDAAPASTGSDDHEEAGAAAVRSEAARVAFVMAAVDAVDSAGFHGTAEELDAATEINSRLAGKVGDILVALRAAGWEGELEHGAAEMIEALDALHHSLEAADLAAAREAAHDVHDAQHHFSGEAYEWLAAQAPHADGDDDVLATSVAAIDIIDSTGFHGIGEDLASATEVSPRTTGQVGNALIALRAAVWPEQTAHDAEALEAVLDRLHHELEAGDLAAAIEAAGAVHDAQHEFSHHWYGWLAENHASIDHHDAVAQLCALKAADLVNSAGLHGVSEDLATAEEIGPRLAGTVERLVALTSGVLRHGPTAEAGGRMHEALVALQGAIEANDLEQARASAAEAHDAQHGLSTVTISWIAASTAESES
jgi:soluble cytochrome b562